MTTNIVSLNWFYKLRIFAACCQVIILFIAEFYFTTKLPVLSILLCIALIPVSQIIVPLVQKLGASTKVVGGALLIFDTLILTVILKLSGGAANPFSIVYFLHVVLAAFILGKSWTWSLAGLTCLCFSLLFLESTPHSHHMHHGASDYSAHLYGMFFSYCLVVMFSAYFLSKIINELRMKESEVKNLEAAQNNLLSMTALSTNAAHELSTPLATIQLIAGELLQSQLQINSDDLQEDLKTLKQEAQRCKHILDQICSESGNPKAEENQTISLISLQAHLQDSLKATAVKINWIIGDKNKTINLPLRSITTALKTLIENALDASDNNSKPVEVVMNIDQNSLDVSVKDFGIGIPKEDLEKLGEAFFTSKNDGMGLGIYLARLIALQLGGQLEYSSKVGQGTIARFQVPEAGQIVRGLAV